MHATCMRQRAERRVARRVARTLVALPLHLLPQPRKEGRGVCGDGRVLTREQTGEGDDKGIRIEMLTDADGS